MVHVDVDDRLRTSRRGHATARRAALGPDAMTGHTADDQAETLLLALLRGAGAAGPRRDRARAGATRSWRCDVPRHRALCAQLGLAVAEDPSNDDPRFRRNRIRHELLPLLDDIAERDVTVLLARTADLLRADDQFLDELAADIDPTDAAALAAAPGVLAARAIRQWLDHDGYPPDADAVERVLAVAAGDAAACELVGGRRVERRANRLHLVTTPAPKR